MLHYVVYSVRGTGVWRYLSRKTRDEERETKGIEGSKYRGGADVVLKFVTLFRYEFFTTRKIIRNAVRGYVSTISPNANVRQNVMMMSTFPLRVNILVIFSNLVDWEKLIFTEPQLCACMGERLESLTVRIFCFSKRLRSFVARTC